MADNVYRFRRLKWGPPGRLTGAPPLPASQRPASLLGSIGILVFAFAVSAAGFGWLFGALDPPAGALPRVAGLGPAPADRLVDLRFGRCVAGQRRDCVIDGDTLRIGPTIVRLADIDTPEVRNYGCAAEMALGDRATARLLALVNAGPFAVEGYSRDEDVYGRKLRILTRDGRSLGTMLVAEGLARPWGGSRQPWC